MQVYIIISEGSVIMLILNILDTLANQFASFWADVKDIFIDMFGGLHTFLNKFMSDDAITVFGIIIISLLAIAIFRYVINKR